MKFTKTQHQLQQLISGDILHITSFVFRGSRPGPSVYLQANIHGPEIFGSILLIRLIHVLQQQKNIYGTITIVPQANPIGVQSQTYGFIHGRWNTQTGNDWNRIFAKLIGDSIESKLARTLLDLAKNHDYVLDIHTSGSETIPHLYTSEQASKSFSALGCAYHILYTKEDYYGAFDETIWQNSELCGFKVSAATWEVSSHVSIGEQDLIKRLIDLLHWLASLGVITFSKKGDQDKPICVEMKKIKWFSTPQAGYLTWTTAIGIRLEKDECYAYLHEPWSGNIKRLLAKQSMTILSYGTLQAVSSGQEIGKMIVW